MNFLSPLMLGGLAAVSIPVIIHLLNKFRVKKTDWGAMRFLLDSIRKNEKRVKIEDLILLILRCLVVAIAVLAFARPALQALMQSGSNDSGPVAAVVLLDNSASMGQSAGAMTRFDQAKKAARTWIDQLDDQSLAALYLVSNRTEALIPKPSPDFALFRKMLEEANPSDRGSELSQAVRLACESLKSITGRPREIRIYTDGQAAAWAKRDDLRKLAEENPDIHIKPIIIGEKGGDNVGIVALRAEGGIAAARQPCRFQVEVGNYGAAPVEGLKVTMNIDGGPPAGDALIARIEPGATQSVSILVSFPDAGPHAITATIPPDAYATDNQRTAALDIVGQMNVLIAEENREGPAMDRDGFFLANALIPLPRDTVTRHYLAAVFTSPAELAGELSNANNNATQSVFLCNAGALSAEATQTLQKYVQTGGNLVIFPGPNTDPTAWKANAMLWEMLPAELAPPTEETEGLQPLTWQATGFTHPVTALWNDSAQGSLGAVKVLRHFPLTLKRGPAPGSESPPRVVVQLSNGEPAVVEWAYGEGHVVVFNSTATPEWNNLPLHPAFVPFLQRLMGNLNRKNESRLVLTPGEPFRKPVPDVYKGKDFAVLKPGADKSRTAGQVSADDKQSFIRYADTEKAGPYRVTVGPDPVAVFAVQLDGAESDLRKVEQAALDEVTNVKRGQPEVAAAPKMVVTREFWTPLIWLVALLFIVEAIMAHRISLARQP